MTRRQTGLGLAAAFAAILFAWPALAQQTAPYRSLDQLEPAPAGDAFFGVPSPFVGGHAVARGLLLFDYARRPLVIASGTPADAIVKSQAILHLNASLALWDRLMLSALFPLAVYQSGDNPVLGTTLYASPSSVQAGDARLGIRVRLLGEEDEPFQAAIGFYLHLPTGPSGSYMGEGAVRDSPHLVFGGRIQQIAVWSAALGVAFRGSDTPSTFTYNAAIHARLWEDRLQVGPEMFGATELPPAFTGKQLDRWSKDIDNNLEVLMAARLRIYEGFVGGLAAGPGFTHAIGTPSYRIVVGFGWMPKAISTGEQGPSGDTDADGIPDTSDACPYAFGEKDDNPKRHGCPIKDDEADPSTPEPKEDQPPPTDEPEKAPSNETENGG